MKHLLKLFFALAVAGSTGCIKNDIPYPVVKLAITSIAGEGFTVKEIDPAQRIVTLTLDETTDIRNVRITQVAYTEGAQASVDLTASSHDMRVPVRLTLTLYQDYEWTIIAEQQINRTFTVAGQIGAPVIDAEKRSATAYVGKDIDRSKIDVTALRLEPEVYENGVNTTTYSPTLEQLSGSSFETVRVVDVSCHGRTEKWLLYVLPTDRSVALEAADAWSRVIWLYGSGVEGQKMGFRYRLAGGEWQEVADVTVDGGSFSARLAAEPETTYEVLAYCGDEQTDPTSVTTDPEQALENGGFENWCTLDGIVYPYADGASPYWGTGNKGSKIANATLTDKGDPRPGSSGPHETAHLGTLQPGRYRPGEELSRGYGDQDRRQRQRTYLYRPGHLECRRVRQGQHGRTARLVRVAHLHRHARRLDLLQVRRQGCHRIRRARLQGECRGVDPDHRTDRVSHDGYAADAPDDRLLGLALGRLLHRKHPE